MKKLIVDETVMSYKKVCEVLNVEKFNIPDYVGDLDDLFFVKLHQVNFKPDSDDDLFNAVIANSKVLLNVDTKSGLVKSLDGPIYITTWSGGSQNPKGNLRVIWVDAEQTDDNGSPRQESTVIFNKRSDGNNPFFEDCFIKNSTVRVAATFNKSLFNDIKS